MKTKRIIIIVSISIAIFFIAFHLFAQNNSGVPNILSVEKVNYKTAFKLYKDGEYKRASNEFSEIINKNSEKVVMDYAIYYAGRSALFLDNYDEAINMFSRLEQEYKSSRLLGFATQYKELALFYKNDYPVTDFYKSNKQKWLKNFVSIRALNELDNLNKDGVYSDKLKELSLNLINNFDSYEGALYYHANFKDDISNSSDVFKMKMADIFYANNSITISKSYFNELKDNKQYYEKALYYLARANQRTGKRETATTLFNELLNDGNNTYKKEALFYLAENYNSLKNYTEADKFYITFIDEYKNDKTYTPQALRRLVVNNIRRDDLASAKKYITIIVSDFPNTRLEDIAIRNYVRKAFNDGDKKETYYTIDILKKRYVTSRDDYPLSWELWAGDEFNDTAKRDNAVLKTLLTSKNPHHIKGALTFANENILHEVALSNSYYYNTALEFYENNDYSNALKMLDGVQFLNSIIQGNDTPFLVNVRKLSMNILSKNQFVKDFYAKKTDKELFKELSTQTGKKSDRAVALYYYEDYDNAYSEYNNLIKDVDMTYPVFHFAKKIFIDSDNHKRLIQISASIGRYFDYPYSDNVELLPDDIRKLVYPRMFDEYVLPQADHYKIEPAFAYAIMREESLFDIKAKSFANAYGLMQLIPGTADMENRLPRYRYKPMNLHDAEQNINLGIAHLSRLFKSENASNYIMVASKYNAGPGNGNKWKKAYGTNNMYYTARLVDLEETEYYIERVMKSYDFYTRFYDK